MVKLLAPMVLIAFHAVVLSRPAGRKLVDLSYVFDESTIGFLGERPFQMTVNENGTTDFEGIEIWLQREEISSATHVGTHIDAPCHMAKGRWTVDKIPLTHLIAPAAVVDITRRADTNPDALLLISDLENWERMSGRTLDGTIVLVRTGWGSRWPNREAYIGTTDNDLTRLSYPAVSPEAARWLVHNRNIYGLGIDTLSIDNGRNFMRGTLAHLPILDANVYILENLANLHKLPGYGAQLDVSPMKIGQACGSPTRIIAVLP